MININWVLIRSWHIVRGSTRNGTWLTICGKTAKEDAIIADNLPLGSKSCESCLRIYAKDA